MHRSALVGLTALALGCGRIGFDPLADTNLRAWYPFDRDDLARARDESGSGLDAECATPVCPALVPGRIGTAREFDGLQALVATGSTSLDGLSAFTVALWVRPSSGAVTALSKPQVAGPGASWEIVASTDTVWFCSDGDPSPAGEECIQLAFDLSSRWHHIAGTWDGSTKTLYVDRSQAAEAPAEVAFDGSDVVIGSDREDGMLSTAFIGAIDDVRIYDVALSAREIAALP